VTRRTLTRRLATAAATAALVVVCIFALNRYDGGVSRQGSQERLYFPSGQFLREAACGFREVAADYLWFQAVQYYGGYRKGEHDMRYFDLLIESITRLDPRFVEAYYFASLVYSLDYGDVPRAVTILGRGITRNPDVASLPFHAGFLYYVFRKNYPRARIWFDRAASRPDASEFHKRFAAFARRRAGDLEGSLGLWRHLRDTATNPELRNVAEEHIAACERQLAERAASGRHGGVPAERP
jgi:tetratricopeptide (TPR) repeat protein